MTSIVAAACLLILAQTPAPAPTPSPSPTVTQEVAPWMQIGSSLGFAALVWYLVTVQMPRREKEHADLLREAHKEHNSVMTAERDSCERRHQELLAAFQSLVDAAGRTHEIVREVRHEVNNIAHTRAMDRAVQEAKAKQPRGT